jgi:hypothetical protein
MRHKIVWILFLMVAGLAGARAGQQGKSNMPANGQSIPQPAKPIVTAATLKVVDPILSANGSCSGHCPMTIRFSGTIQVSQACTVRYRFDRSDGTVGPMITLYCGSAGSHSVSDTWTLASSCSGWEAIEVLSPPPSPFMVNAKANFTLICVPSIQLDTAEAYRGRFFIAGHNLGNTQGTKDISLDGKLVSTLPGYSIESWGQSCCPPQIWLTYPDDLIPWDHTYQIAITDGGKIVSNVLMEKFYYYVETQGHGCTPGGIFDCVVPQLPPTQGDFTVHLLSNVVGSSGDYLLTVISWTRTSNDGTIRVQVPLNVVPGSYGVALFKSGTYVSYGGLNGCLMVITASK